ncbi:MAG: sigma-70 family RNA polymerase sigma factor [Pirellulaceae bacterium]|nr:sigma-70 family RNA polymerase sigma factor [Pirellulaceae bacterium]
MHESFLEPERRELLDRLLDPAQNEDSRRETADLLYAKLAELHLRRLTAIGRRFYLGGSPPNVVAHDALVKFIERLQFGGKSEVDALLRAREEPLLSTITRQMCINIYRKDKAQERARQGYAGRQWESREHDLETGAFLVAAIQLLPTNERRIVEVDLGWDDDYLRLYHDPPSHGDTDQVAGYLGLPREACFRLRCSAKKRLRERARCFEETGKFDIAEGLRSLTTARPRSDRFSSLFYRDIAAARYAIRLVELARQVGTARLRDLLQALEQSDFTADPLASRSFLQHLRQPELLAAASPPERRDILLATAVLFDHLAARAEREADWAAARRLIEAGLETLNEIFPDRCDPLHAKSVAGDRYTRVLLQRGILLRRFHEVAGRLPQSPGLGKLCRARELFGQVLIHAERPDHRISALHQEAICDLIDGRLDEACARLALCIEGWEFLSQTCPEDAVEYDFRVAYEHRRLGNVAAARMALEHDREKAAHWREEALNELGIAESISRRFGNHRYLDELDEEQRKVTALFLSRHECSSAATT